MDAGFSLDGGYSFKVDGSVHFDNSLSTESYQNGAPGTHRFIGSDFRYEQTWASVQYGGCAYNEDYVRAVENYGDVFFNPNNAPPHTGGCMSTGTYATVNGHGGWALDRGKGYHYTTSFGAFGFVGGSSAGFTSTVTIAYTNTASRATYVCGPLNHLDPLTAPILYNRPT
ncbi:MAG: hypothetical protein ACR2FF_00740 [Mycobacteriales bacterium]|nr:MAG: hypothetical protein DLM56_02890 [Pseudonocardiales bacterium]